MLRSLAAAALLTLVPLLAPPVSAQEPTGVQPGDQITTDFYTAGGQQIQAIEGTRLVDRDGNIFLPFVGTVRVAGLDAERIRTLLEQKYTPFYADPVVSVQVLLRVNVTGVVRAPGHYFLDPTTTIVDALSSAGGAGSELLESANTGGAANVSEIRLVRAGKTIVLDLRPESVTPETLEMRIQSGDWIHVPPRPRSRVRDDIQFWGSLISVVTSVVAAVVIIKGN